MNRLLLLEKFWLQFLFFGTSKLKNNLKATSFFHLLDGYLQDSQPPHIFYSDSQTRIIVYQERTRTHRKIGI